jgi:hypothetical protein
LENEQPVAIANHPGFSLLSDILRGIGGKWFTGAHMIGLTSPKRPIAFHSFNTPDTLALIDPVKRDAYLDELVEEVTAAIEQFYAACEHDPRLTEQAEW